jgi:hypothetical protein
VRDVSFQKRAARLERGGGRPRLVRELDVVVDGGVGGEPLSGLDGLELESRRRQVGRLGDGGVRLRASGRRPGGVRSGVVWTDELAAVADVARGEVR